MQAVNRWSRGRAWSLPAQGLDPTECPTCRRCGRRPAGTCGLGSGLSGRRCIRSDAALRSLPASGGAPSTSVLCAQTKGSGLHTPEAMLTHCWKSRADMMPRLPEMMQTCSLAIVRKHCSFTLSQAELCCLHTYLWQPRQGSTIDFTWAVHGLESELLLLYLKVEHILFVVICMAGRLPEVEVVDVWRHNLLILILPILFSDVLQKNPQVFSEAIIKHNLP